MPHPAHMFTEVQSKAWIAEVNKQLDARKARQEAAAKTPKSPLKPLAFADADEAGAAREYFELQPNAEEILRLTNEELNELYELEAAQLSILEHGVRKMSKSDADHCKRKLLGY